MAEAPQADANEIIEDQANTIGQLFKENSILKSQLKAAQRLLDEADEPDKKVTRNAK